MSKPSEKIKMLSVNRYALKKQSMISYDPKILEDEMKNILTNKIHGISFSPYLDDQDPSEKSQITEEQIAKRLSIIENHTDWIRTFSCANGNEEVPRIAHEKNLKVFAGVWLGEDLEENEIEMENMIRIAKEGHVDMIGVGNEVLLREDFEVEQLITYIKRIKKAVPHIPVGYVDAYYMFVNYPELIDECDVLFANCYPFWEYCDLDISVDYMKTMYELVSKYANGKKIIISETGWPNKGEVYGGAKPSYENAMRYFISTMNWANKENIDVFYFSSFDEVWKQNHEGEYGAYWGLWDKEGNYKYNKNSK